MTIPYHKLHGAKNDFLLTAGGDLPPGLDLPASALLDMLLLPLAVLTVLGVGYQATGGL